MCDILWKRRHVSRDLWIMRVSCTCFLFYLSWQLCQEGDRDIAGHRQTSCFVRANASRKVVARSSKLYKRTRWRLDDREKLIDTFGRACYKIGRLRVYCSERFTCLFRYYILGNSEYVSSALGYENNQLGVF